MDKNVFGLSGSLEIEQGFHPFHVGFIDDGGLAQILLALGILLGQDVAFESFLPLYLAGSSNLEAFLGP
jgi:hypothetical protein